MGNELEKLWKYLLAQFYVRTRLHIILSILLLDIYDIIPTGDVELIRTTSELLCTTSELLRTTSELLRTTSELLRTTSEHLCTTSELLCTTSELLYKRKEASQNLTLLTD